MHFTPLIWCEDFREALPEFVEVYGSVTKFNLNFHWIDEKGIEKCSGNCNVVYFKNHVLTVFPQKSGVFLVLLYEAKLRNERPFFRAICKGYLDENFILTRDGFSFVQGAGKQYKFLRRKHRRSVLPKEEYNRAKFKEETLAIINGEGDIVC